MIKKTIQIGNTVLRKVSKKVDVKDINSRKIKGLISDLSDTMREKKLIGIAAPQINSDLKVFITEIRKTKNRKSADIDVLRVFINPKIIEMSKGVCKMYEGCGSIASGDLFAPVERPREITIEAFNETGEKFNLKAKGLLARVIQHEYDHLNGILFIDKVKRTKDYMSGEEYRKMMNKKRKNKKSK